MLILKRLTIIASAGKDLDHIGDFHTLLMVMFNYTTPLGNILQYFIKLNIYLSCDALLSVYPKAVKTYVHNETCIIMLYL